MVETVVAVVVLTFVFLALFSLSHLLMEKILVEHAAMRVARARAVGFNEFMCRKAACVAVIPVAGKRLWPIGDELSAAGEFARVRTYLESPDYARASGLLDYENWHKMTVDSGDGGQCVVNLKTGLFRVEGKAGITDSASFFMEGGQ